MDGFTDVETKAAWLFLDNFINISGLDEQWFSRSFHSHKKEELFGPWNYRIHIIDTIRKKYTPEEFYQHERVINFLYWNLKQKIKNYVHDDRTILCGSERCEAFIKKCNLSPEFTVIDSPPLEENHSSTVNSYTQFNEILGKWYILKKICFLDELCMNIMMNRDLYEKIVSNPQNIESFNQTDSNFLELHYHKNYPFPNVNPMFFNMNDKKYWLDKINKMYYTEDDKYWYNLINFE